MVQIPNLNSGLGQFRGWRDHERIARAEVNRAVESATEFLSTTRAERIKEIRHSLNTNVAEFSKRQQMGIARSISPALYLAGAGKVEKLLRLATKVEGR